MAEGQFVLIYIPHLLPSSIINERLRLPQALRIWINHIRRSCHYNCGTNRYDENAQKIYSRSWEIFL